MKHGLREPFYVRYMDDFLIIHPSKKHLHDVKAQLAQFAGTELALMLHPKKTNVHKFMGTERFVGYDGGLFVRRLSKPTVQRFLRRMKRVSRTHGQAKVQDSWQQFRAYATFAHAKGLMDAISPATEKDGRNEP